MWESACGIQKHFDKRPSKRLGLDQFRYWPSAAAKDTAWLLSIKSSTAISARPRNGHYKSRKKSRKPFAFATLYSRRRRRQPKKNKKKEEGTTINRVVTISGGRTPFPAQKKKENLVCLIKFVCVCVCVKQRPSGEIIDFLSPARQKHSILYFDDWLPFPYWQQLVQQNNLLELSPGRANGQQGVGSTSSIELNGSGGDGERQRVSVMLL